MSKDRLSEIWSGFSSQTKINLGATSVKMTPRPHPERRSEAQDVDFGMQTPVRAGLSHEGASDPVRAALSAMHDQMADKPKSKKRAAAVQAHYSADNPVPPETSIERTLLADLAFTRSKTTRDDSDYVKYAADRQAEWQRKSRKKWFFGLF